MDELDALGGHAAAEQARLHCVDVRGAELGELDVADGRGDVQGDDGAVAPGGGLPAMRDDDVLEPAVEPLADCDLLGWKVDAPVEGGQQPAELALCGGFRSLNGNELAAPFAEGVAAQVDGELVGARRPLADGAFHFSCPLASMRPASTKLSCMREMTGDILSKVCLTDIKNGLIASPSLIAVSWTQSPHQLAKHGLLAGATKSIDDSLTARLHLGHIVVVIQYS